MINCYGSSDLDRPAHRLEASPYGFEIDSASVFCSSKDAKESARSRHEVRKEGKCVGVSPRDPWT